MKNIIGFFLMLIFSFSIYSQSVFEFGFKGGLSIVDLVQEDLPSGLEDLEIKYRASFHFGAFSVYKLDQKIGFQAGLIFSSQGGSRDVVFRDSANALPSTERPAIVYNYLNVPLLFRYNLKKGLVVKSGPQIGFLLSAKVKNIESTSLNLDPELDDDLDIKDDLNSIDISWVFETGYEFDFGLLIDLAYNLGLSSTAKEGDSKVKNSVIQLSVGYKF